LIMAKIIVKNLRKYYGAALALDGVSFELEEGDFLTVMGESGCGKTTLLKCLAGLIEVSSGEIYCDGEVYNDVSVRERNVAFVSQEFSLFPNMTVFENVMFSLKKYKMSYDEKCARTWQILEKTGLKSIQNAFPKELSYGQRQKTAIARALVKTPKTVLFDEPLSNVDIVSKVEYKKLIAETKTTFPESIYIYVTHNAGDAKTLGNKTMVMSKGKILQFGKTKEVFDYPFKEEVALICFENARKYTAVFSGESIVSHDEVFYLPPFLKETVSLSEGDTVYCVSDAQQTAFFDKDGNSVCGYKSVVELPCVLNNNNFVLGDTAFSYGELKDGVLKTGEGLLRCSADKITAVYGDKTACENEAVLPAKPLYEDENYAVFGLLNKKISLPKENVNDIFKKSNDMAAECKIILKYDDLSFLTKEYDIAVADYRIYPNFCTARVIKKKDGVVAVGGVKLRLSRPLGNKKEVGLLFQKDAFVPVKDKKGFKVLNVHNVQKGENETIVFAVVQGFDKYVTLSFKNRDYVEDCKYLKADESKIIVEDI